VYSQTYPKLQLILTEIVPAAASTENSSMDRSPPQGNEGTVLFKVKSLAEISFAVSVLPFAAYLGP